MEVERTMMERLLKNNLIVKVFSFLLALMLWVYVTSGAVRTIPDMTDNFRNVPLAVLNLEDGLAVMEIPAEVDVVLNGRQDIIGAITPQNIRAFVDLRALGEGTHRITPDADVPQGVRILRFAPPQVTVVIERVESPQVPVTLEIIGTPAEGYVMGDPRILPDSVFVRGPRSALANVDSVRAVINVDGADGNRVQIVPVQVVDNAGREVEGVTVTPDLVEVQIPFSEPQKTVPVRVPLIEEPAEGYKVQQVNVTPSTVTVQGREEMLANIEEILTGQVSIADASETITLVLPLIAPENTQIIDVTTVSVEIIIAVE
jgi:YbbR domain-containing protein